MSTKGRKSRRSKRKNSRSIDGDATSHSLVIFLFREPVYWLSSAIEKWIRTSFLWAFVTHSRWARSTFTSGGNARVNREMRGCRITRYTIVNLLKHRINIMNCAMQASRRKLWKLKMKVLQLDATFRKWWPFVWWEQRPSSLLISFNGS